MRSVHKAKDVEVDYEIDRHDIADFIDEQTTYEDLQEIQDMLNERMEYLKFIPRYLIEPPNLAAQVELEEFLEEYKKKWNIID
jgi:hypothetical protein